MSPLSMLFSFAVGALIGHVMTKIIPNRKESLLWTVIWCLLFALTFGRFLP